MTTNLTTAAGFVAAIATVLSDPDVIHDPARLTQALAMAVLGFLAKGI